MPLPCLKPRRSSKVCPAPNSSLDVDLVEVRKGRMLRIQHINPRLRNKQVPQTKHGKSHAPAATPLELHVPRVSFYGNKCVVTDAPTSNSNHVKNGGSGPSPNNNRTPGPVSGQSSNGSRFVKSNSFPSNLSKEQKRMLFKMGVRSVSALKNIVLFFFHGVGGSSDIWQTQINYFSSLGFEIVAPDLIGHGMSEVPLKKRAYHFREILADVIAIFDRYCKKKNLVIGHSYGCAFTTVLARERARRVWRLIMISGGGPIPLAPEIGIFAFPLWFVSCVRPCLDQVFEKSAFKKKQKNEMLKRASFNIPSFVLHYVINGQDWPEGDEVYHSWISVPTLLINGREDTFATLDDAKLMKATIHGSKLEIVDEASHMVMLEAPDKVNKLILDFICSRGSHKLPDVKESAEEGQESPLKTISACSYGSGVGDKAVPTFHLHQHQHTVPQYYGAPEERLKTPTQSPRSNIMAARTATSSSSQPPATIDGERRKYAEEGEVDFYTPKSFNEETVARGNSTPWQKWSKKQQKSSYDNASYESDESAEEYYYYKDQYGNHHYVSATEYARQFPHRQLPPVDYRTNEVEMEVSTFDIPAFEDISVDRSTDTDGNITEGDSTPDYSPEKIFPVEINTNQPNDLNTDGSPGYMEFRKTNLSDNESLEKTCEDPSSFRETYVREIDENQPPKFSVPELQYCEECLQKKDNATTMKDCEKCISINMSSAEYRNHQNSNTRRQSVTLALGRQRSDSLDYLGQEQLIIITCYDETEEEEISISSSAEDAYNDRWRRSNEQQSNQRVTRHDHRTGVPEVEEVTCKKPTLPTLEEGEEYSPRASPTVGVRKCRQESEPIRKQNTPREDLVRSLHMELLAKVNKRNRVCEERKIPEVEVSKSDTNSSPASEPSPEEGVICRSSSFLESKKLMEAHFSKPAFKMQARYPLPTLPISGRSSPSEGPPNRDTLKDLSPKSGSSNYSPSPIRREQSENNILESSPSFLQSKRVIQEHFSKVGLSSPMSRPFSSPNLVGYGNGSYLHGISPQKDRKLSNSSPSSLGKPLTSPGKAITSKLCPSDDECQTSQSLSVSESAEKRRKRESESVSPEKSKTPGESVESESVASSASSSGSSSPIKISLRLNEWAERHLKIIAASLSPSSSPHKDNSNKNISQTSPSGKHVVTMEEKGPRSSLSLNDWAERHLKLVGFQLSPTRNVSGKFENETRTSPEKDAAVHKSAASDGAQEQDVPKVAEMKRLSANESAKVITKSTINSDHSSVKSDVKRSQERKTSKLSLSEWAERHARKIDEMNSRSPKIMQVTHSDAESSPVCAYGSIPTPERSGKTIRKISTHALNEWAEKHIRAISEQRLVAGPPKEENIFANDNKNENEEPKNSQESATSTVQSDHSNSLSFSQNEDQFPDSEEEISKEININTSLTDARKDSKSENDRDLNVCKLDKSEITQEVESPHQSCLSNKPVFSNLQETTAPEAVIAVDMQMKSCVDTLTDSPISEESSSAILQRRRSSSSQSQVVQEHGQDNKDDGSQFLSSNNAVNNNNNNINNNNSNSNNNNAELGQTLSRERSRSPTFDDNSNVVASTSISQEDKDTDDKDAALSEEQQSCCYQSVDKAVTTDNDNNRIKTHTTSVATTDSDSPSLNEVSNEIAYTTI